MDALKTPGECAFCAMEKSLEDNALNFLMGPSVAYMQDDVRMKTNETGFCQRHYRSLHASQNRLGLALMLHTHTARVNKDLAPVLDGLSSQKPKKSIFGKPQEGSPLKAYIEKLEKNCYICGMMEKTFQRYVDTFFQLWKADDDIKELVKKGSGFCLPHFSLAAEQASIKLSPEEGRDFCKTVAALQKENMKRIEEELEWFIKKFDYRFTNEPWGNAKDSIERGIQKLSGDEI